MICLNNEQIQALADGEAGDDVRRHAEACTRCAARLRTREGELAAMLDSVNIPISVPPSAARRIETMLEDGRAEHAAVALPARRGGATRLRSDAAESRRRRAFWSAAMAAAATLAGVFVIAPMFRARTTVSAAEILAASANRLAESPASGVELLEYELVLDGVPRELLPDHVDGRYRVRQLFDHDTTGRYHFTMYARDGTILSSISQDPVNGRRVMLMRIDDQPYRFEFTLPATLPVSLPELERMHMQATVAMMQTSGAQQLQTVQTPDGAAYQIDVPRVDGAATNAMWDLAEARAVIDADDYRILELRVKGAFMKQPYSISFRLIQRSVTSGADVPAAEFEIPEVPGTIVLRGEGGAIPGRDAFVAALREMTRARRAQ